MSEIRIYTDGSASVRSKLGGAGCYLIDDEIEVFIQKGFSNTKIGRCEIHALLLALRIVQDKSRRVVIYSDSKYVVCGIESHWVECWERDGYFQRTNADLWKQVLEEYRKFPKGSVRLKHLRGHQKNLTDPHILGNNIADTLADYKQFTKYEEDRKL